MPSLPSFIGGAYTSRSRRLSAQRCVNLYAEKDEAESGASPGALIGTPGLVPFATIPGTGAMRGLFFSGNGRCFAVRGQGIYDIFNNGSINQIGLLASAEGPVSFADNGQHGFMVDGLAGYSISYGGGGWTQLPVSQFQPATHVVFLDGYFIANVVGSGQFQLSPLYSVGPWDPLDIATAEGSPDALVALSIFRRELRLFGAISTENWFNAGGADFPLARNPSGFIDTGCGAPFSVAQDRDAAYWLAADRRGTRQIVRSTGYEAQRISTHALALALGGYARVDDALGWCYDQEDHQFYMLTFPSANATWCYDATTGLWHERSYWNSATGRFERHRANCYVSAYGRHLVGDRENGKVYALSLDTYTDDGAPIRRVRSAAHLQQPDLNYIAYNRFLLNADVGYGLDGGIVPGGSPVVALRYSNDGGVTWSDYAHRSLGMIGDYQIRAQWDKLGVARDRVFEVSSDAPVRQRWVAAHIQVSGGYV